MVLSEFLFYFIFLFFRRQAFRMITFDRQAGPFQNVGRSRVMVIGKGYRFPTPRDPRVGAWGAGRPKHPKIPPPNLCVRFRAPGTFLKNKILVERKPQDHFYPKKNVS